MSRLPERWKVSQVHFVDRYEGDRLLERQRRASCWPTLKKKAFCKTCLELIGESSQPTLVGTIANLALSHPFSDSTVHGANVFPNQSPVYRSPRTELHEKINIFC